MKIPFNNTYIKLPEEFYTKINPMQVNKPSLIHFNQELAEDLGFSGSDSDEDWAEIFSGNQLIEGSEPLAMVYAGHQFGGFSHQLGDGRAVLLGEVIATDGVRYDLQLKGSGRTPYSRGGDGRSALGPVLREYIVSEAMAKLGVPTTRALAVVTTGEEVARMSLVPGGILTRISKGFVRVGTFEYFSARQNNQAIKQLADYEIERHYPEAKKVENPYVDFLRRVVDRQARLIARWMHVGFIHGVMNTDNMSIVGETIDYGPCAFMDEFEFNRIYSSIDHRARYAYNKQPTIGQWNLVRLAEAILPLLAEEGDMDKAVQTAQDVLNGYAALYKKYWLTGMRGKLGLIEKKEGDEELALQLLETMENNQADFTLTFFYLSGLDGVESPKDEAFNALFSDANKSKDWLTLWRIRLDEESSEDGVRQKSMRAANPVYIPRNHQIEAAISAAEDNNDFSAFHELHEVLQNPYERQDGKDRYMLSPNPEEIVQQTFCGT